MANISDVRKIGTPQRAYEFEVEIHGVAIPGEVFTQKVQAVTMPEVAHDQIEINFKSSKSMWAGRDASPHLVTVSFFEDEDHLTYGMFRQWAAAIRDPRVGGGNSTGGFDGRSRNGNYGQAYMVIKMLKHDSTTPSKMYKLTHVWPQSVGEVSLSYENSDHMKFDVTFSYDEQEAMPG